MSYLPIFEAFQEYKKIELDYDDMDLMRNLFDEITHKHSKMTKFEMCSCGHFGGHSPDEQHKPRFQKGHGQCKECSCEQFTWVGFCNSKGIIA